MPTYTGPSIVDYLKSVGKPSDVSSRITLGKQYGIDYTKTTTGYANENVKLLGLLRTSSAPTIGGFPLQKTGQETPLSLSSFGKPKVVDPSTNLGYSSPSPEEAAGIAEEKVRIDKENLGYASPSPEEAAGIAAETSVTITSATPKVGNSQISAGKEAIRDLTSLGVSTDINTIRSNWSKFGLNTKLGSWVGNAYQWNAYAKYTKDELDRIEAGVKNVQSQFDTLQERIRTEGITEATTPTPTGGGDAGGDGDISKGGTVLDPSTLNNVQLDSNDIGDIITEMETGDLATPETVIAGEETKLLTDAEKAKAAQVLSQFQQQMATAGQAFSSIRSSGEASLAAESLARQSGIKLDLASKIINAARQEQTRRINATKLQQDAQTAALKSMGYVINPVTGKMSKTLERQRFDEPEQPVRFASGGSYYEYDPSTGGIRTLVEGVGSQPNSFQEWTLAGEEAGTGKSYSQFLEDRGETQSEKTTALKIAAFTLAEPELKAHMGTAEGEKFVDTAVYLRLRSDFARTIGDVSDFDEVFGHLLNPNDPTASALLAQIIGI